MKALEILSDLARVIGKIADDEAAAADNVGVVNPGRRADSQGSYKWSPPLQQQLDAVKDSVGVSVDTISPEEAEAEAANGQNQENTLNQLRKSLASLVQGL